MKKFFYFLSVFLLSIVLSGCSQTTNDINDPSTSQNTNNQASTEQDTQNPAEGVVKKELIKIGVLAPLSGGASSYGKDAVNTYTKSVDDFNKNNLGPKVELVVEDSKCNGKDSISAVQKLINIDKVDFIIGGICSSETTAAGKIAQNKKIVMLSPVSSSPDISEIGDYIYRYPNSAHAGLELSKYLQSKYKNITLIVENTDYAKVLATKLKSLYTGIIDLEIDFDSDEKDFGIIANNIDKVDSEALVLLNQTESSVISLMKALEGKGLIQKYKKENILGAYFFSGDTVKDALGKEYMEGFVQVNIDLVSGANQKVLDFIDEFKKEYEVHFDASFIYLEKEAIDFALESISNGVTNSEEFKVALDSITKANPRQGYFGEYYLDEQGDAIGIKYVIEKITQDGVEKLSY